MLQRLPRADQSTWSPGAMCGSINIQGCPRKKQLLSDFCDFKKKVKKSRGKGAPFKGATAFFNEYFFLGKTL